MKSYLLLPFAALLSSMFVSCEPVGGGSANGNTLAGDLAESELEQTHLLLSTEYLYYEEVGPISNYAGHGNTSKDGEFADVVYMFGSLSDQFTRYFTPDQAQEALNAYSGDDAEAYIGIKMQVIDDTLEVLQVVPDSPAEDQDMHKHDQIIKVNKTDVTGDNASKYASLTQGGAGTKFNLTLKRGKDTLVVTIQKKVMVLPTVWIDTVSNIPVIQVDFFASSNEAGTGGSASEFDEALSKIDNAHIAIIDLRGNPGGSVDDCLRMTDALLDTGLIVYELNRRYNENLDTTVVDTTIPRRVRDNGTEAEHRPYVFLADSGSASCSEIMLAGIQENKDWPIIGTQSYGKGIGQSLGQTNAGGLVVVTTTEFRNKRMINYHHKGITPDIQVLDPDSQMVTAVRTAQAILDTLGDGKSTSSALAKTLARKTLDRKALLRVDGLHKQIPERPNGAFRFIK